MPASSIIPINRLIVLDTLDNREVSPSSSPQKWRMHLVERRDVDMDVMTLQSRRMLHSGNVDLAGLVTSRYRLPHRLAHNAFIRMSKTRPGCRNSTA
jgi:hypothetical protein